MRSFDADPSVTVEDVHGQKVHRRALEQSARMVRTFYDVAPGVWTLVGNGLSNQSFIDGPDGVIAIDTGESNEEMAAALRELKSSYSLFYRVERRADVTNGHAGDDQG